MSPIDIGIVVFALAMAAIGWERGFIGSAIPLVGFVAGIAIGARVAPSLLDGGAESPYAPAVAAAGGVLLGVFLAVALEGVGTGLGVRLAQRPVTRIANAVGGAVLFVALALLASWVFGAVALYAPSQDARGLREAVQRSSILTALNDTFPPSGDFLNALRTIDPAREVKGPDADVAGPNRAIVDDAELRAASSSVVRVSGSACGLGIEGSGWIAAPGVVVTNAHVVAGQEDTTITDAAGLTHEADVVRYQPRNDLAVLRATTLEGNALALAPDPSRGVPGAAVGYPGGGSLSLSPVRLGRTGTVQSEDSYGRGPVTRRMTPFRGRVRSGNSGGPVIDGEGRVLATVFAASLDGGPPSGLGIPNSIVERALKRDLTPTSTGPCAA